MADIDKDTRILGYELQGLVVGLIVGVIIVSLL
jgi:uncharacterized membrane-anchored protein YhcB (DUF1043 family)